MNATTRTLLAAPVLLTLFGCLGFCGGGTEGINPGECEDGADNDGDGVYDCEDPDCAGAPACNEVEDTDGEIGETDEPEESDGPVDSDGDGLTNAEEADLGTDPDDPDSDGDGEWDGDEYDNGTNPNWEYSHSGYTGDYNVGYCADGIAAPTGPTGQGSYGSHRWDAYRVGDVVRNFTLLDQHGDYVDLYSFCGQVIVLSFGAFW